MRSTSLGTALLAGLFLILPASAQDRKKDKKAPPTVDSDKLAAGEYTGKLKTTPGSDGEFTVEVEVPHLELKNPNQIPRSNNNQLNNIYREQQRIVQLQGQLAASRTPQEYARNLQSLQNALLQLERSIAQAGLKAGQNPYKTVYTKTEVTFHSDDKLKVRNANLPEQFDDKGNPKKYTAEEKAALKGKDKSLPGYEAKVEDLTIGQMVKVTLKKAPKKPEAAKPKEGDKDAKDAKDTEPKMIATMILILSEPDSKDTTPKKPKK
jgi:hypothetical protein